MRNHALIASAAPAANQDAPYHDLFSLLHKLGQVRQFGVADWERLMDMLDADGHARVTYSGRHFIQPAIDRQNFTGIDTDNFAHDPIRTEGADTAAQVAIPLEAIIVDDVDIDLALCLDAQRITVPDHDVVDDTPTRGLGPTAPSLRQGNRGRGRGRGNFWRFSDRVHFRHRCTQGDHIHDARLLDKTPEELAKISCFSFVQHTIGQCIGQPQVDGVVWVLVKPVPVFTQPTEQVVGLGLNEHAIGHHPFDQVHEVIGGTAQRWRRAHRLSPVDDHRNPLEFYLTDVPAGNNTSPAPAKSGAGIGLPDSKAQQALSAEPALFSCPLRSGRLHARFMAGGARGASAPPALGPVRPTRTVRRLRLVSNRRTPTIQGVHHA